MEEQMMLIQRKLEQKSHDNEVLQDNLKQALKREPKRDILYISSHIYA